VSKELTLPAAVGSEGNRRLWAARNRVADGPPQRRQRSERRRAAVIAVALQHHIVSQYTSLVAIDQTPQGLSATAKPRPLPDANSARPRTTRHACRKTATAGGFLLLIGDRSLLLLSSQLKFTK